MLYAHYGLTWGSIPFSLRNWLKGGYISMLLQLPREEKGKVANSVVQVIRDCTQKWHMSLPLTVYWTKLVTWSPSNCKGNWKCRGSCGIFAELCLCHVVNLGGTFLFPVCEDSYHERMLNFIKVLQLPILYGFSLSYITWGMIFIDSLTLHPCTPEINPSGSCYVILLL